MEKKKKSWTQWIVPIIFCLMIGALAVIIMLSNQEEPPEDEFLPYGYVEDKDTYTLENDELLFEMDAETTQFTVTKKSTGYVWKSNPDGIANDALALGAEKQKLNATLNVEYTTINGVVTVLDNYEYSITRGLYEIEEGEGFIRVNYTVGDLSREYIIPPIATVERFEGMLAQMEASAARTVKNNYKLYDLDNLSKRDDPDELLELYPMLAEGPVYVIREGTKEFLLGNMETIFEAIGYTYEDYEADLANFTSTATNTKPAFNVSVVYTLEGSDLVVDVPTDSIDYRRDYPMTGVCILPYYAAAGTEDDGFIILPEGGGAYINFNNGKLSQNGYYSNMYGWDFAQERKYMVGETHSDFNLFGMCFTEAQSSVLCIIDKGAAFASVRGDIAGRYHSYNYSNCYFKLLHSEGYEVSSTSTNPVYVFEAKLPDGAVGMRYRHIDSCEYSAIADSYQDYLFGRTGGLQVSDSESTPVIIEVLGAVDKTQQVFGIPRSVPLALTTFDEAVEMLADISARGISNISVQMSGWVNGGIRQQVLNRVKLVKDLGSKSDFTSMIETAKSLGMDIYLDGIIDFAYNNTLFDGFSVFSDAARFSDDERVMMRSFSPIYFGPETNKDPYYLLNNENRVNNFKNLVKAVDTYGASGISLRDEGKYLSADYNADALFTREESITFLRNELQQLNSDGKRVMILQGNDYAVLYSDIIGDMALEGNLYTILDGTVPLYQMVLHGYVDYTGKAINLEKDYQKAILKAAETGAGLKFTLMKEPVSSLQDTNYSQYYGADYDQWAETINEIYDRYNQELGHIFNLEMTDYSNLTSLVTATTYSDGTVVYVNYSSQDYTDGTVTVPTRDYFVKKGTE